MGSAADGLLLFAIESLFAGRDASDARASLARGAWLTSHYDKISITEINESGGIETTLEAGGRTPVSVAVEAVLTARVRTTGRTASTLDRLDDKHAQAAVDAYVERGSLCVVRPLVAHDETVGMLSLHYENRLALDAHEFDALRRLAVSGAMVLANARQRALFHTYAFTDQLTGLPNRRHLENEFKQLRGSPMSLLLIDLDGLKSVNDQLGYDRGDVLLKVFSTELAAALLPGESAARYGGDEFVVLMPGGDAKRATARAEALTVVLEQVACPPDVARSYRGASVGCVTATGADDPAASLRRAAAEMRSRKRRRATDRALSEDAASRDGKARTAPTSGFGPT